MKISEIGQTENLRSLSRLPGIADIFNFVNTDSSAIQTGFERANMDADSASVSQGNQVFSIF